MKKILTIALLSIFALVGCSDKDEISKDQKVNHDFKEFSLDVDYSATQSYEAKYEEEANKREASIEDYRTKENLQGDMAFEKLNPLLESLTFTAGTPDAEVIAEVLATFGLDANYTEFDLDVTFSDGTVVEYKNVQ